MKIVVPPPSDTLTSFSSLLLGIVCCDGWLEGAFVAFFTVVIGFTVGDGLGCMEGKVVGEMVAIFSFDAWKFQKQSGVGAGRLNEGRIRY